MFDGVDKHGTKFPNCPKRTQQQARGLRKCDQQDRADSGVWEGSWPKKAKRGCTQQQSRQRRSGTKEEKGALELAVKDATHYFVSMFLLSPAPRGQLTSRPRTQTTPVNAPSIATSRPSAILISWDVVAAPGARSCSSQGQPPRTRTPISPVDAPSPSCISVLVVLAASTEDSAITARTAIDCSRCSWWLGVDCSKAVFSGGGGR